MDSYPNLHLQCDFWPAILSQRLGVVLRLQIFDVSRQERLRSYKHVPNPVHSRSATFQGGFIP